MEEVMEIKTNEKLDSPNLKKEKKSHGEGSIHQRKDGRWIARIQHGYKPNGKPNMLEKYGKTEAEAKRKLRELKKVIHRDDFAVVKKQTVQSYMTTWLTTVKVNELKPKSYDRLETTLNHQVFPKIGQLQIGSVTSDDVQKMVNDLFDEDLSYSTVKKAFDAVNDCFRTGIIKKSVMTNPALGVTLRTKEKKAVSDINFYSADEASIIIANATKHYGNGAPIYRLGYALVLALHTGLRVSELVALKWKEHVDFKNRLIRVENTMVVVKNRDKDASTSFTLIEQHDTKSRSGKRTLYLNDVAFDALKNLYEVTGHGTYVLESKNGRPIYPKNLDRMLRNVCVKAEFPEGKIFGMHSLRHTFASMLFAKDVPVKTISEILGHADTKITENIYIHIIEAQRVEAVQRIVNF